MKPISFVASDLGYFIIMKEIITLRRILESRYPKGSRLFSKKNTHLTPKKKK